MGDVLSKISPKDLEEGKDLDFIDEKEQWNTYKLSDGTKLTVKLVLRGVKRLKIHGPDGIPIYMINSINIVRAIDVDKKLCAKPKENTFHPI